MAKHRDNDEMMMYKSTEDATKRGVFQSYVVRGSRSARSWQVDLQQRQCLAWGWQTIRGQIQLVQESPSSLQLHVLHL
jgi:hypothetical protein